jgi:hypothetical protein
MPSFAFLTVPAAPASTPPNFRGGASKLPQITAAQAGGVTGSPGTPPARRRRFPSGLLNQKLDPFGHQLKKRIPVGDGKIKTGIESITVEALQKFVPAPAIEQFVARDKFLPWAFMVLVRGDNEGVDLLRLGTVEEDKIDLVKSAIG